MIVVDAAALTNALVYADDRGRNARAALGRDPEWAAPEHWKAEVFAAVRGLALGRKISTDQAARAVDRIPRLAVDHVSLDPCCPGCGSAGRESAATMPPTWCWRRLASSPW